ncbi:hypothetical protein ABZW49_10255 [Nonomuraea wenchangensis]
MPARVRSFSVASSDTETVTITKPAGTAAGDVLLAIHYIFITNDDSRAPSGWTSMADEEWGSGLIGVRVYRKTATASEPGVYEFEQSAAATGTLHLLALADVDLSMSPRISVDVVTGTTVSTPSVQPAAAATLEIRSAGVIPFLSETISWTAPSGYASKGTVQGVGTASIVASRALNSSAPAGVKDFLFSPATDRFGVGVSVSIASVVTEPDTGPPPPSWAPGVGDALYSYRFRRLRDGQFLGFLDLTNVSFDKRINQPGSFSATVPIPSREVGDLVAEVFPRDGSTLNAGAGVVVVDIIRGGDIWGEYWITTANPSRSGRGTPQLQLQGTTLDGYLSAVELQTEGGLSFEQIDQIEIMRQLVADMQADPYADIDLTVLPGLSGVARDRTYTDDGGTYGQRIRELAEVDDGFEYTINVIASGGGVARVLTWGYPRLGDGTVKHIVADGPNGGDLTSWGEQVDALRGATRYRARGGTPPSGTDASVQSTPLMSTVHEATAHLTAGWPRIDRTLSYSDVVIPETLEDYAAYWVSVAPGALRVETYTVTLGAAPSLHPNLLGDTCRIYLDNEWHTRHYRDRRIIGLRITPISRSSGKEQAELVLEGQVS